MHNIECGKTNFFLSIYKDTPNMMFYGNHCSSNMLFHQTYHGFLWVKTYLSKSLVCNRLHVCAQRVSLSDANVRSLIDRQPCLEACSRGSEVRASCCVPRRSAPWVARARSEQSRLVIVRVEEKKAPRLVSSANMLAMIYPSESVEMIQEQLKIPQIICGEVVPSSGWAARGPPDTLGPL